MNIIDPRDVKKEDLPRIVLVQDVYSFFGFGIRVFSKGSYNHVMMQYDPDYVASQNTLFHSAPIENYMKPNIKMKFFGFSQITSGQRQLMFEEIQRDLKKPWYKRTYDPVGILGHILRIPNTLEIPFMNYCTEKEIKYIRYGGYGPPAHPSVKELNMWLVTFPEEFSRDGYYVVED